MQSTIVQPDRWYASHCRRNGARIRAPWHYVHIPVTENTFDEQRDGRRCDNVIDALNAQIKTLSDKSQSREKRAEELKWIVHLVGDLHQSTVDRQRPSEGCPLARLLGRRISRRVC